MEHCKKHPPVFYTPSFEGAKSYGDFDLSVAIDQNVQERGKRVNKITSIYGRPARQILGFMNDGLALYVNQKKTRLCTVKAAAIAAGSVRSRTGNGRDFGVPEICAHPRHLRLKNFRIRPFRGQEGAVRDSSFSSVPSRFKICAGRISKATGKRSVEPSRFPQKAPAPALTP